MAIKATPTAHLILQRREAEIFFLRRKDTGDFDGMLDLPGGKLEENETPILACIREAREEAGVIVRATDLNQVHVQYNPSSRGHYVNFYFTTWKWEGDPRNAEPDQCSEGIWVHPQKLDENVISHIRDAVTKAVNGEKFYRELKSAT